jgi:hypothetical protein
MINLARAPRVSPFIYMSERPRSGAPTRTGIFDVSDLNGSTISLAGRCSIIQILLLEVSFLSRYTITGIANGIRIGYERFGRLSHASAPEQGRRG